mgnify:CR=1 FL=1
MCGQLSAQRPAVLARKFNFRRLQARTVPAPSIDLNSLPLVYFGLEIILDLERSTEWSPLLNSHHVPPMRINLSSSLGSNFHKEMVVSRGAEVRVTLLWTTSEEGITRVW